MRNRWLWVLGLGSVGVAVGFALTRDESKAWKLPTPPVPPLPPEGELPQGPEAGPEPVPELPPIPDPLPGPAVSPPEPAPPVAQGPTQMNIGQQQAQPAAQTWRAGFNAGARRYTSPGYQVVIEPDSEFVVDQTQSYWVWYVWEGDTERDIGTRDEALDSGRGNTGPEALTGARDYIESL